MVFHSKIFGDEVIRSKVKRAALFSYKNLLPYLINRVTKL